MNNLRISRWVAGLACALLLGPSYAWEVDLPNGRFRDSVTDLQVKVRGGYVRLVREYDSQLGWRFNPAWAPLVLEGREHSLGCGGSGDLLPAQSLAASYDLCRIRRNDTEFRLDAAGQVLVLKDSARYVLRPLWVAGATQSLRQVAAGEAGLAARVTGFRWEDRVAGNWIEYDATGQVRRYGDRSNVAVTLQYNTDRQLIGVLDPLGRKVLELEYDAERRLSVVRDVPGAGDTWPVRSVRYAYQTAGDGNPSTPAPADIAAVTDVRGNVTRYGYNGQGLLVTLTNAEAEKLTVAYGSAGKVSEITEADGAKTSYDYSLNKLTKEFTARITYPATSAGREREEQVYDAEGKLIRTLIGGELRSKVTRESDRLSVREDGLGRKTVIETDAFGNVIRTVFADGSSRTSRYSLLHGQVEEEVDELGVRTTYAYDVQGRLLRKVEAAGRPEARTTEYEWDESGQLLAQTLKGGTVTLPGGQVVTVADATVTYAYDAQGNRQRVTDPEQNTTTLTYDRLGLVLTQTDARQQVWTRDYDAAGNLVRESNPLQQGTSFTHDRLGRVRTQTDALSHTTTYAYDVRGKLVKVTDARNGVRETQYDARGRVAWEIDALGKTQVTYTYGANGLPATMTDGNGNVTSYSYDKAWQLVAVQYPTYREEYGYDLRGQRTRTTQHLGEGVTHVREVGLDARGQVVRQVDHNGKVTLSQYDGLGRVVAVTDPAQGVTRYSHDSRDNLVALTDAHGHSTIYAHDRNNRTLSETRPEGQAQAYAYGPTGLVTRVTDAKGNRRDFAYDAAGRRTDEHLTAAGAAAPIRHIGYEYNAVGTLVGWQDSNGAPGMVALSARYTPDELQRITEETVTYGAQSFTTRMAYDPNGRRQQLTYPDGYVVQYGYDDYQQLSQISLPEGAISFLQPRWNQPQLVQFPGGSTQQRSYDALGRLTDVRVQAPSQQERYRLHNVYDPESNITQQSGTVGTVNYGYDALYRLVSAQQPSPLQDEQYSYDALGNRLTDGRRGGAQAWQYNGNNQLLQSYARGGEPVTHAYDANGSLTGRSSAASEPGLNRQFLYDAANRLAEVRDAGGALLARYQHDPLGRRVAKTVFDAQGTPTATWFVYGRDGLLLEADGEGRTRSAYGWRPNGAWGTAPQFLRTRPAGAPVSESLATYYVQNDHLGTSQRILDAAGAVVWARSAQAFGEMAAPAVELIRNPLRFPGQYHDVESGQDYNLFRNYEAENGRYSQQDPVGLFGGANAYSYTNSRPIVGFDNLGLWLKLAGGVNAPLTPALVGLGGEAGMLELVCCEGGVKLKRRYAYYEAGPSFGAMVRFGLSVQLNLVALGKLPTCKDPTSSPWSLQLGFLTFGEDSVEIGMSWGFSARWNLVYGYKLVDQYEAGTCCD